MRSRRINYFGACCDLLTMRETLERVDQVIGDRMPVQHVVINVAKLVMMQRDLALKQAVNSCPLINVDGQGIVWGARLFGVKIPERVTGIDLMLALVARAAAKGYRLFFLGARQDVLSKAVDVLMQQYPELQICGYRNGYFSAHEEAGIVRKIRDSNTDILFLAMSSPKKELFLNKYVQSMRVPFVMGVGGSLDIVAGVTKRAPVWMQKAGFEWLYRLMNEPKRMWKRYLTTNMIYAGMVLKALVLRKEVSRDEP